jgi:hypothetical protein
MILRNDLCSIKKLIPSLHNTIEHGNQELTKSIFLYLKKQLNQTTPNHNKETWYMVTHTKIKRHCYSNFRHLHVIVKSTTDRQNINTKDEQYIDYGMFILSLTN